VLAESLRRGLDYEELFESARKDALTGLSNRRVFEERIRDMMNGAKRYKRPLTMASLDLDHFKQVNDNLGHQEGDIVLKKVADVFKRAIRETDMLVRFGGDEFILVDCTANPLVRLEQAGLSPERLSHLILTHFHPDHVSGVPLLLMDLWLLGRKSALTIHGLPHTLDRLEALMRAFGWENWPNFYTVDFRRLPEEPLSLVLETANLRVLSSPVEHLIPTVGLRFENRARRSALAYSCDTQPSSAVVKLAEGADTLIHEATGEAPGHSSARQAGSIAQQAGVRRLYLIHYAVRGAEAETLVGEARRTFAGEIYLAKDFLPIEF
jgi:ribonuclease Z